MLLKILAKMIIREMAGESDSCKWILQLSF
jgi:hypothetical protein